MTTTEQAAGTGYRIGYGRVSTEDQNLDSQRDELTEAGCDEVYVDKLSGKLASRPELDKALARLRPGDTLVITRLSRAMRSLRQLLEMADSLKARGVHLKVLNQDIDTSTATGRFLFHILAAVDELQRDVIVESTHEGLAAARARGRTGGRPASLKPEQVTLARKLDAERTEDGKRAYTVTQIAAMLKVSRPTLYRALEAA